MSIKSSLLAVTLSVGLLVGITVGSVSIWNLNRAMRTEAQRRVNHDLEIAASDFSSRVESLSESLKQQSEGIKRALSGGEDGKRIRSELQRMKAALNLTVLNICGPEGELLYGSYPDDGKPVPVDRDPVLRRALQGEAAAGTVLLGPERLETEGGPALKKAAVIYENSSSTEPAAESALFRWTALPILDDNGMVIALLYGGQMLNYNFAVVDQLQSLIFGQDFHAGKPVGTVTIFLQSIRIATNVRGPDNSRALGTRVSKEVEQRVIDRGERWNDRAYVVDSWYISAYQPLSDPDGRIIGMLYVGLLEAPYAETARSVILSVIWPALGLIAVAVVVSLLFIGRITSPLSKLNDAVSNLREANWDYSFEMPSSFREINQLSATVQEMQAAIAARDKSLQDKNRSLEETNEELHETNQNYMQMLGFVTHELKSPMAAAQQMLGLILDGIVRDSDKQEDILTRVHRALEQSQDMIKNYLDMTRVERGELRCDPAAIDLIADVVTPVVEQNRPLYENKNIALEVDGPEKLDITGDPELLKIALTNYVNNAAKYGKEGGKARLEVARRGGWVTVSMWNEGDGFTEEEGGKLFQKFSRLRNNASRGSRGSGLGLYLTRHIAELHGGEVDAESELGNWARFSISVPLPLPQKSACAAGDDSGGDS